MEKRRCYEWHFDKPQRGAAIADNHIFLVLYNECYVNHEKFIPHIGRNSTRMKKYLNFWIKE